MSKQTVLVLGHAVTCAALCLLLVSLKGFSIQAVLYCLLFALLTRVSYVDFKTRTIENTSILGIFMLWLIMVVLTLPARLESPLETLMPVLQSVQETVLYCLDGIAAAVFLFIFLMIVTLLTESLSNTSMFGGGDIKLLSVTALFIGLQNVPVYLCSSCLIFSVFSVLFHMKQYRKQVQKDSSLLKTTYPFGPAISLAFALCILLL